MGSHRPVACESLAAPERSSKNEAIGRNECPAECESLQMDGERLWRVRQLARELTAILIWDALWNDDEHARIARQLRREEILRELNRMAV